MSILFRCPDCSQKLTVEDRKIGHAIRCPACGNEAVVPQQSLAVKPPVEEEPPPTKPPLPIYLEEEGDDDDAGFVVSRRAADDEEMDLTPMVDVTFLLLIFFMITASFSMQKTIQIPPSDKDNKGATQSIENPQEILEESIRVEITGENTILVEDEELSDPDDLENRLLELMQGAEGKNELVLSADDKSFHEITIKVIDIANKIGMQRIRLATYAGAGD